MNMDPLNIYLWGTLTMACFVTGLFFFRFWRSSRDRFFVFFSWAFWLLGLNWIVLAVIPWEEETRHRAYVVRLLAFVLILAGIIDKNRRARAREATKDEPAAPR